MTASPRPPARSRPPTWLGVLRAQLLWVGPALAVASLLGLAGLLSCTDCTFDPLHQIVRGLGLAAFLWGLLVAASFSQRWLPTQAQRRRRGLAAQIGLLTALSVPLAVLFGTDDLSAYAVQTQLTVVACACLVVEYRERARRGQADAQALLHSEQDLARQLDAARMQLLQAQVEPHFLFNTLAHLRRLAHTDALAARAMLADLRVYLAAALPELRQAHTPLARELELVAAFLALHQRRIGPERLRLAFEIDPELGTCRVPSTCLLTLAENAIKHGIGPLVEGGEITVRAGRDAQAPDRLRLELADTGVGMSASSGGGTGLSTLRARLTAAYGAEARLSLYLNQPRGLIACVQMPVQMPRQMPLPVPPP